MPEQDKLKHVLNVSKMLVEFLTKFTDYLANLKYPFKDMAIVREYLEVFKWDVVRIDHIDLGQSADLLTACFATNSAFWT